MGIAAHWKQCKLIIAKKNQSDMIKSESVLENNEHFPERRNQNRTPNPIPKTRSKCIMRQPKTAK